MKAPYWTVGVVVLAGALFFALNSYMYNEKQAAPEQVLEAPDPATHTFYERYNLRTDTTKTSINLEEILSGGPGKDGIPAIMDPSFVSIARAQVGEGTLGVFMHVGGTKRFYPYNILVWHEIVNDSIGKTDFAVTFCPLCGSAIVFDRRVGEETLTFGVSGLLFESNLLMYDTKTESLWSQAKNEAVVGELTGSKLQLLDMRLMEFSTLKRLHPDARVLSRETGYSRNYDVDPYAGYGLVDDLYFPTSVNDTRLPPKEIMYVVPFEGRSVAFPETELTDTSSFVVAGVTLTATRKEDGIEVIASGEVLPGYYEMWFSWATHHQEDGVLWKL